MERRWLGLITRGWLAVVAVAAALTAALAMAAIAPARPPAHAPAQPVARAARSCGLAGEWNSLGPTYVELLNVTGTNCTTGAKVIEAYNRCRLNAGGVKGSCHSKVLGFRCSEKRSTGPVQFVASAHCTARREVVTFSYSENT
jgi:hypothetical protein